MTDREIACALVLRETDAGTEVLLEQRAASNTVMPGMWELPSLEVASARSFHETMIVRHAIMQVNYTVRVFSLSLHDMSSIVANAAQQRWMPLPETSAMALTGLARKVLTRAGLLKPEAQARFASSEIRELV
jgi:adenine-specific DNA glycosylase